MDALLLRRRTLLVAVSLLALAMVPLAPAALADGGTEAQFVSQVNQERRAAGLSEVRVAGDLTAVARRHSERMASAADLHHNPDLGGDVSGWKKVGENVGRGPSAGAIHQGFMNSPSHRQNILDGDWTEVGVGVVVRDGQVWVTQVFRLPANAPAAPAPEPEPEPASAPTTEPAGSTAPAESAPAESAPSPGADAEEPAPEPEPEPTGPRHEVEPRPTGLDRGLVTLARLEATEQGSTISAALH